MDTNVVKPKGAATRPRRLTYKQRMFARNYVATKGNATEAAMLVYDTKNRAVAGDIGHTVLKKPDVRALIESYAARAAERIEQLGENARSEHVKLEANRDILDRAGFAAPKTLNDNRTLVISISGESAGRYALAAEKVVQSVTDVSDTQKDITDTTPPSESL